MIFVLVDKVTYGAWKGKAVYIDIELIKVDDKGFKEYELEERVEILSTFYATYDKSKPADKIASMVDKAGVDKFPKLCRQLYAKSCELQHNCQLFFEFSFGNAEITENCP